MVMLSTKTVNTEKQQDESNEKQNLPGKMIYRMSVRALKIEPE